MSQLSFSASPSSSSYSSIRNIKNWVLFCLAGQGQLEVRLLHWNQCTTSKVDSNYDDRHVMIIGLIVLGPTYDWEGNKLSYNNCCIKFLHLLVAFFALVALQHSYIYAMFMIWLYPCSTKTREVLGNPSTKPKRFPKTRKISRGRSLREISRVEGNLDGGGDGFPILSSLAGKYWF